MRGLVPRIHALVSYRDLWMAVSPPGLVSTDRRRRSPVAAMTMEGSEGPRR